MPVLTPQYVADVETNMRYITDNEYGRLAQNTWWQQIASVKYTDKAKDIIAWLLSTAQIRDEGTKGGNIHFEDLVAAQTTLEHRFSGAGLKLLRQQFEDSDGDGWNLAAEWSAQIGAQMAYWPQQKVADFLKNAHLAEYATGYDGKPFFATDHPVNPYRETVTFANVFTGNQTATNPGPLRIDESISVEAAMANLQKIYAYIASIKMPNGEQPRYLRPKALLVPPALMFRAVQLTQTKVIAQSVTGGGAASADVELAVRALGYAMPIQVDELAGYEGDTTFFVAAEQIAASDLGGIVFIQREPYNITYYGPQTDAELSRKDELEWHCKGRNAVQGGHPYLLFKVRAT